MRQNFTPVLSYLLKDEGGVCWRGPQADPGGLTNLGVTRKAWEAYTGKPASEDEMRSLTPFQVTGLYLQDYWIPAGCDRLTYGLDYVVFDYAVNSGPAHAVRDLQLLLGGITIDGILGPATVAAVAAKQAWKGGSAVGMYWLLAEYCSARIDHLKALPNFKDNPGWLPRVNRVAYRAINMFSPPL